jgi:hypothetical protein
METVSSFLESLNPDARCNLATAEPSSIQDDEKIKASLPVPFSTFLGGLWGSHVPSVPPSHLKLPSSCMPYTSKYLSKAAKVEEAKKTECSGRRTVLYLSRVVWIKSNMHAVRSLYEECMEKRREARSADGALASDEKLDATIKELQSQLAFLSEQEISDGLDNDKWLEKVLKGSPPPSEYLSSVPPSLIEAWLNVDAEMATKQTVDSPSLPSLFPASIPSPAGMLQYLVQVLVKTTAAAVLIKKSNVDSSVGLLPYVSYLNEVEMKVAPRTAFAIQHVESANPIFPIAEVKEDIDEEVEEDVDEEASYSDDENANSSMRDIGSRSFYHALPGSKGLKRPVMVNEDESTFWMKSTPDLLAGLEAASSTKGPDVSRKRKSVVKASIGPSAAVPSEVLSSNGPPAPTTRSSIYASVPVNPLKSAVAHNVKPIARADKPGFGASTSRDFTLEKHRVVSEQRQALMEGKASVNSTKAVGNTGAGAGAASSKGGSKGILENKAGIAVIDENATNTSAKKRKIEPKENVLGSPTIGEIMGALNLMSPITIPEKRVPRSPFPMKR